MQSPNSEYILEVEPIDILDDCLWNSIERDESKITLRLLA